MTAAAAGDGFFGAVGLGKVSEQAAGVGVTAVPSPMDEENWDGWLWHSYFDIRAITATIADGVNAGIAYQRLVIDSKAMRKVDSADVIVGAISVVESGTATMEMNADSRQLIKV